MADAQVQGSVCEVCKGAVWLCAWSGKPADFDSGTCCAEEGDDEQAGGCPSANGCPRGCALAAMGEEA